MKYSPARSWVPVPLALALSALTPLRPRLSRAATARDEHAATALYPLIGIAIGLAAVGALMLPVGPAPRAVLALAAWVVLTGARGVDGWARCAEAALAPSAGTADETRARRQAILAEPRAGTAGTTALVLLLLAKGAALASAWTWAPLAAAPLARWALVYALGAYPSRRRGPGALWPATIVAMAVLVPLTVRAADPVRVAVAVVLGTLAALSLLDVLSRRFGALPDAARAAACEAAELAVLWTLL